MTTTKERTYSDDEIKARLSRELPHWYLEGGWIRRKYRTHGWKGTLMIINTVGHLAEAAWHHPHGSKCGCRTTPPRASPTRISSWPRRSKRSCTGSPANRAVRWKARRKTISGSLTSNTIPDARVLPLHSAME